MKILLKTVSTSMLIPRDSQYHHVMLPTASDWGKAAHMINGVLTQALPWGSAL